MHAWFVEGQRMKGEWKVVSFIVSYAYSISCGTVLRMIHFGDREKTLALNYQNRSQVKVQRNEERKRRKVKLCSAKKYRFMHHINPSSLIPRALLVHRSPVTISAKPPRVGRVGWHPLFHRYFPWFMMEGPHATIVLACYDAWNQIQLDFTVTLVQRLGLQLLLLDQATYVSRSIPLTQVPFGFPPRVYCISEGVSERWHSRMPQMWWRIWWHRLAVR